jgi:hypothetical protein
MQARREALALVSFVHQGYRVARLRCLEQVGIIIPARRCARGPHMSTYGWCAYVLPVIQHAYLLSDICQQPNLADQLTCQPGAF